MNTIDKTPDTCAIGDDELQTLMTDQTAPSIVRGAARGALRSPDAAYATRARARCAAYLSKRQMNAKHEESE